MSAAPPLPPRGTSDASASVPKQPTAVQQVPQQPKPASNEGDDMKSKAVNLLMRRREAYVTNARLAVEDGNSVYAKECAETVMMFDQALEACEEQEVTMDDLSEIPGTPPPYKVKIQK